MADDRSSNSSRGSSPHSLGKRSYRLAFDVDSYEAPSVYSTPLKCSPAVAQGDSKRSANSVSVSSGSPPSSVKSIDPQCDSLDPSQVKRRKKFPVQSNGMASHRRGDSHKGPPVRRAKKTVKQLPVELAADAQSSTGQRRVQKVRDGHGKRRSGAQEVKAVTIRYGNGSAAAKGIAEMITSSTSSCESHNPDLQRADDKHPHQLETVAREPRGVHPFFRVGKVASTVKPNLEIAAPKKQKPDHLTSRICAKPQPKANSPCQDSAPVSQVTQSLASLKHKTLGGWPCLFPSAEQVHVRDSEGTHPDRRTAGVRVILPYHRNLTIHQQHKLPTSQERPWTTNICTHKRKHREIAEPSDTLLRYSELVRYRTEAQTPSVLVGRSEVPSKVIMSRKAIQAWAKQQLLVTKNGESVDRADGHVEHNRRLGNQDEVDEMRRKPKIASMSDLSLPVQKLWKSLATGLSAYDSGSWESSNWAQKYAPQSSLDHLNNCREVRTLRDWLSQVKVACNSISLNSVPTGNSKHHSKKSEGKVRDTRSLAQKDEKRVKKRQKRAEELGNFIVSSDEEAEQLTTLDDLSDDEPEPSAYSAKSIIRSARATKAGSTGPRLTHAMLLSGPQGCGKSAAVYAAAKEAGFEVFEINPGTRRNGSDILEKVGNMTQNHQVGNGSSSTGPTADKSSFTPSASPESKTKIKITSDKQKTMQSFLTAGRVKHRPADDSQTQPQPRQRQPAVQQTSRGPSGPSQLQRQSLILLDEVDILFEEDERFWITVIMLIKDSKRPIIMTCSDESSLPLESLPHQEILRFAAAEAHVLTDYLQLLACHEGHLLGRAVIHQLVEESGSDLRAAINNLQFWCQMGLGSRKGGLDWLPVQHSHPREERIMSQETYTNDLRYSDRQNSLLLEDPVELRASLAIALAERSTLDPIDCLAGSLVGHSLEPPSRDLGSTVICHLSDLLETASGADLYSRYGIVNEPLSAMNCSLPPPSQNDLDDRLTGTWYADDVPLTDLWSATTQLATHTSASVQILLSKMGYSWNQGPILEAFDPAVARIMRKSLTSLELSTTFPPVLSALPLLSIAAIIQDVSPYARSIVRSDFAISARRIAASGLLSMADHYSQFGRIVGAQPATASVRTDDAGNVTTKSKPRMTRAALSALEGGLRGEKRRDRWFGKAVQGEAILDTGGDSWGDIAERWVETERDRLAATASTTS